MEREYDFLTDDGDEFSIDNILNQYGTGETAKIDDEDQLESLSSESSNNSNKSQSILDITGFEESNVPETDDEPEEESRRKPSRKKGCLVTFIWILIIALLSTGLAVGVLVFVADSMGLGKSKVFGGNKQTVIVTIEQGTSINEISQKLEEENVIISDIMFRMYLKVTGKGSNVNFNYGAHSFQPNVGYDTILETLAEPAVVPDVEVTIKSSMRIDEIGKLLESKGVCKQRDFIDSCNNDEFDSELVKAIPKDERMQFPLEGYLFPDTYNFYPDDSPKRVIQCMIDNLEKKFTPELRQEAKSRGYTTHEIISLASVIELESCGYYDEMPNVSAVFANRLEQWTPAYLQSDPTMFYPYGNGIYDTYENPGIPIGACSNFTEAALKAAIYPTKDSTDFFFVTDSEHRFYYTKTNDEHNAIIAQLQADGLWAEQ